MKKLLFILCATTIFLSCEVNSTHLESSEPVNWKIIDLEVASTDWKYSQNNANNFYSASFSIPELTQSIYNNGIISLYLELQNADGSASQSPLPSVRHYETKDDAGNPIYYTQTVDYEYSQENIMIFFTSSDFFEETPPNMHFVLKMIW